MGPFTHWGGAGGFRRVPPSTLLGEPELLELLRQELLVEPVAVHQPNQFWNSWKKKIIINIKKIINIKEKKKDICKRLSKLVENGKSKTL